MIEWLILGTIWAVICAAWAAAWYYGGGNRWD